MNTIRMKQVSKHITSLCFSLALMMASSFALAVPPQSISYQAYLKDSGGLPVNATENVTFRLYNADIGGALLWSHILSVVITDGLFSVELGTIGNPLPKASMDNPMWLGVEINTDGEAVPRKAFNSINNAFRAEDSDTLQGQNAASLDQSAHVGDTGNPHSVTAAQTGAATTVIVSAHTGDTANPHSVTAAQVGAVTTADITTHTLNAAAHHSRYSDPESIAAMGAMGDANALNHDKYTDANTVAAVLSADGAGSTLDADLVDGLQASEIIDAAQDEVRTPISSLPFIINTSGSYYVTGNLDGSSGGIDIRADDVTLDLMGFTLDGGGTVSDYGIYFSSQSNVTIHNGTVRGFGFTGFYQGSATDRYARVIDVRVLDNGTLGTTSILYSGIFLSGSNNLILRCTAGGNGYYGLFAGSSSLIKDSTAYSNQHIGIYGSLGSTLNNNTAYSNQNSGIYGHAGSTLSNNTAYSNQNIGIYGSSGSTLSNNTAHFNQSWGIYAAGANNVRSNTAYNNNQAQKANKGGIYIGYDSLIINNTTDSNYHSGIYVGSTDNVLRNNHATDSLAVGGVSQCIYFASSDNAAIGNTATGCTTEFAGSLPPASRYIDNIGW